VEVGRVRTSRGAGWVTLAGAAYGGLFLLGRGLGSDLVERTIRLPGDELVEDGGMVTDHATSIDATAEAVWPWLMQMGYHRGGWYTPRWVDRLLFPANWPSAVHLDEVLSRELEPGDVIPDGPPGTAYFVVTHAECPTVLVLHSTTHVPRGWRRLGRNDWVWTFTLTDCGPARTRLHVRTRARTSPWWLRAAYVVALVPADAVMSTAMLRGIRRRAETGGPGLLPSTPNARRWGHGA
jgi:hypothetical protein